MRLWIAVVLCLTLISCGGTPTITAKQVFDRLQASGLATNGRTVPAAAADSPLSACTDRLAFDIPGAPDHLAVIDICPKAVSDAVLAQPTTAPVVGMNVTPLRYRSAGGSVVVTVDALTPPDVATRLENEVRLIPE